MSYIKNIPIADLSNYKQTGNWDSVYKQQVKKFKASNPNVDISTMKITLEDCIISSVCNFTGEYECEIEFKNCYFRSNILFHDVKFNKRICISHCFCDEELIVTKSSLFEGDFDLIVFSVKRQVLVQGGQFDDCKWNVIDNGRIVVSGGAFGSLDIGYWGGCILDELSISLKKVKGLIRITGEKSKINTLMLSQSSVDVSISIEDINVNLFSIYRFRNEKSLRLMNIKALNGKLPAEFSIAESYLGKAEFYAIDFVSFEQVNFLNVHLTECSFVDMTWKFDIKSLKGRRIGKTKDEETLPFIIAQIEKDNSDQFIANDLLKRSTVVRKYYSKNRENYRQLKFVLSKQGDVINEQKFHAKEMIAYNRCLLLDEDPWTKIIIRMSQLFSDFGQSFSKPLTALIIGHLAFVFILILSNQIEGVSISLLNASKEGFQKAFEQYFILINPLRKADGLFKGYSVVIDVLMRIWASYMIYNIIRASRRFIK